MECRRNETDAKKIKLDTFCKPGLKQVAFDEATNSSQTKAVQVDDRCTSILLRFGNINLCE